MARFVFASKQGRLANRLAVSAHLIGAACEANVEFFNPAMDEYAELFRGTAPGLVPKFPAETGSVPTNEERHRAYMSLNVKARLLCLGGRVKLGRMCVIDLSLREDRRDQKVDPHDIFAKYRDFAGTVYMRGWSWRSYENVEKHADRIREYFRLNDPYASRVEENMKKARNLGEVVIGVHIRQGDYRTWRGGMYFHESKVFVRMMHDLADRVGRDRVAFLIASNEPQPPEQFEGLRFHKSEGSPVEDLYSLASCDYLLGPPSTFSNYASFYGNTPLYFIQSDDDVMDIDQFKVCTRV